MARVAVRPPLPRLPAVALVATAPAPGFDINLLPDALLVLDAAGRIHCVNAAATRVLGRVVLPGQQLADVLPLLDERGQDWWAASASARALPGVTRSPERRLVLPARASGARECELLVCAAYARSPEGRLTQVVLTVRDTVNRDRQERSRADLVSTVAHELRSPLTAVKGFTATLLARWDRFTDQQKLHMLTTVNADADRVTRLLAELLDVSRIDSGRVEVRRQVVDLRAAVEQVLAGHLAAGEDAQRFRLEVAANLPEVWADPDKVSQILGNLVENALRHGAGQVEIDIAAQEGEPGAVVSVADHGEGIPDATAARVFTKFWRGGTGRNGTGLGLYIVKGLLEAHGGSIEVGRGPSGGALFRFTLPAAGPPYQL